MSERNPWVLPSVVALLGFLLPVSMLSFVYLTAPDSPLFTGPSLPLAFMPPGSMPDFPNGPMSPVFVGLVGLGVVMSAVFGASAVVLLGTWFRRARYSSLAAAIAGPVALWLLVFVIPMSHRVIRDYNAGFTRTDLLSYTALLWTWVLAAVVAHVVVGRWARKQWASSPT